MYLKKLSYSPDSFKIHLNERELRAMFLALNYFSAHNRSDMAFVTDVMAVKILDSKLLNLSVICNAITD